MEKELWKGNEAIAEAAIRAGCDCFFGYPITPQSEVPEYMSAHLPKAGGVLVQSQLAAGQILLDRVCMPQPVAGQRTVSVGDLHGVTVPVEEVLEDVLAGID